jgi:hypothetical protein
MPSNSLNDGIREIRENFRRRREEAETPLPSVPEESSTTSSDTGYWVARGTAVAQARGASRLSQERMEEYLRAVRFSNPFPPPSSGEQTIENDKERMSDGIVIKVVLIVILLM